MKNKTTYCKLMVAALIGITSVGCSFEHLNEQPEQQTGTNVIVESRTRDGWYEYNILKDSVTEKRFLVIRYIGGSSGDTVVTPIE